MGKQLHRKEKLQYIFLTCMHDPSVGRYFYLFILFASIVSNNVLIVTIYFQLIVEFGVSIAVLVQCFTHKKNIDVLINEKLGVIFPRAVFVFTVV